MFTSRSLAPSILAQCCAPAEHHFASSSCRSLQAMATSSTACFILEHASHSIGDVMGVKGSWSTLHQRRSWCTTVLVALLIVLSLFTEAAHFQAIPPEQLDAMQSLLAAWNTTPNLDINLEDWSSTDMTCVIGEANWRGVQYLFNCDSTSCDCYIIGLTLSNASIVGILPSEFFDITTLVSLQLTGNPNLAGSLPGTIDSSSGFSLDVLDLHDNGFSGTLPDMSGLFTLTNVDLSGNQFVGEYPYNQTFTWFKLQSLSLARNHFNGSVPNDTFVQNDQLESLDLSFNELTGPLPDFTGCIRLQSLILSNNSFNGSLLDLTMPSSLKTLKLSYNNFTGTFPSSSFYNGSGLLSVLDLSGVNLIGPATDWNGSNMTSLEELYLDDNSISGILNLTRLTADGLLRSKSNGSQGLRILSMMNNTITDVLYTEASIIGISTVIKLQGNPYCQKKADDGTRCYCNQFCSNQGSLSNKSVIKIAAATSSTSALVIIILVVVVAVYRSRRYQQYLLLQLRQKFEEFDVKPTIFAYSELKSATRDFHPDMRLGEGGYGVVYKGILPNKNTVAVKQLFVKSSEGVDDFLNEVVLITGMKHRNLVNLKGCCLREHQRLLVYEYVDNSDVDQVLLRGNTPLCCAIRRNICLGVARGLDYLHSLAHPKIIHRDIKASNILLDKNFEPKIADFGLALLFPDDTSHVMTVHIAGTKGYLAPEYASLGQLSDKVDVFSFGVLCLEILSGRRNIDETLPLDEIYLSNWAWKLHGEGKVMDLVDPTLILSGDERMEVQRLIHIALLCSQYEAEKRPTMARVVAMLQYDTESEVELLTSGKRERQLDSVGLDGLGEDDLTAVTEDEAETSSLNPRRSSIGGLTVRRDGDLSVGGTLELSEMSGR